MTALVSRWTASLLAVTLCFALAGCGGNSEPSAPEDDELSQFLEENPDIAAEEADIGDDAAE